MTKQEIEEDFRYMGRLCKRMQAALHRHDEDRAYCFREAARCLAGANIDRKYFGRINKRAFLIEAVVQNGRWSLAERYGRQFTAAVEAGSKATRARLKRPVKLRSSSK